MPRKAKIDCTKCGICCVSQYEQDSYCDISSEKEFSRLGKKNKRYVIFLNAISMFEQSIGCNKLTCAVIKTKTTKQKSGPLKGVKLCACTFLKGTVLEDCRCAVYENRPDICRNVVKPGDNYCLKAREYWKKTLNAKQYPYRYMGK